MRLRFNQLKATLDKGLAAVYLITGDEPLQAMLAADAVRAATRDRGFDERLVLHAEAGFDWAALRMAADNLSLFSSRRLLDLRMPGAKPGVEGGRALVDYAKHPPRDTILLIQSGKLSREALNSAWLKALDRAGVIVQVWPLNAQETVQWITARLAERGLRLSQEAAGLLAERAQGNLLAASQEIDKLAMLYGEAASEGRLLGRDQILTDIADSARFNTFELADAAVAGDCPRAVRILHGLAAEDTSPVLVLWSLTVQLRLLAVISDQVTRGESPDRMIQSAKQQKRSALLKQALRRGTSAVWRAWLRRCARADLVIKGQAPGKPWDELLVLTLGLCGRPLLPAIDEQP